MLAISTTDSSSRQLAAADGHQQVTSPISMTTAQPAAAAEAGPHVSDGAAVVKRDVVSREEDHLALSDLGAEREPVNSMSSARQNNKARPAPSSSLHTVVTVSL